MTMERRTSLRRPITLEAKLTLTGDCFWACEIADFCAEGLFIKYDDDVSFSIREAVQQSPDLKVKVLFTDPTCAKEHTLLVHPVRLIQGAMGVCFIEIDMQAIDAMLNLCVGQDINKPTMHGESDQASFIIRQCNKAIAEHIEPLLDRYASDVDAALVHAANNASSDKLCNELMDVAGTLKEHQSKIRLLTLAGVAAPLKPGRSNDHKSADESVSQLSLIEKNEFEDWLMFKVMVTKAETQYRGLLLQLKMRLDKVGIVNHLGYQNPLGPALIVYAFRDVVTQLNFSAIADKTIFRTFEATVIKNLEDLYQGLNQILIRHNVLPDLDLSKYLTDRKPSDDRTTSKPASEKEKPANENGASLHADLAEKVSAKLDEGLHVASTDANRSGRGVEGKQRNLKSKRVNLKPTPETQNVQSLAPPFQPKTRLSSDDLSQFRAHQRAAQSAYSTINNLFSMLEKNRLVKSGAAVAEDVKNEKLPKWSHDEVQSGLKDMQSSSSIDNSPSSAEVPPLIRRLKEKLESRTGNKKALSQEQEGAVDVVDRFFDSMKTSQKLTEVTKTQLTKLEVPVLKVFMRNKEFFEDIDSPVRAVLNRVAQLGIKGGRPNPANQKKIDGIIQRINNEFEQDTSVFDEVLGELDELVDRQNLLYRRNVERVAAAAEGAQKVVQAKKVVARQIERRIAGRKVPKAVVSLINGGWQDLLSLTYIRQGDQSQAWQDYLGVLDSLLAYGEDPTLDINLTDLLKIIQEGLSSISSNHMPSGHIRDELKRFLINSKDAKAEMIEMPLQQSMDDQPDVSLLTESRHRGMQRWVLRAQKLELGDWLKYIKDPANPQYMRLVWVAKGYSKFVFVNHQGMKVVELDLMTVAGYLQKEIAILEKDYEVPIVDESLDNMVKQVYSQLSFATTHDELTGLVNRKEFERNIENLLGQESGTAECSLLYLDLRQFRIINDAAGYEAGDAILKSVASLLLQYAPNDTVVARLGGNEFGVLVKHSSVDGLAKQYVRQIHENQFKWAGKLYQLAVCIGVASASEVASNTDQLLKVAEATCRKAKRRGPNKVEHYVADESNISQQAQIKAKVAGFSDLNNERTLLRCQKIIPLQSETRVKTHYEILLSVYDDKGHLIPAYEFVRTAEKYNRMQAVDRWVVGHMLDWMTQHKAALESMGGISINLSGHSLNDEELLEFIYHRLSEHDAPIEKLWFEITEAAAISNIHSVAEFMNELKEIGCHFCLGNFGAGMSSYHFLKELPVDMIKIDGTFIKNLTTDAGDRAMVRSMTEVVHFMGKELVATQVEDMQCLDLLTSLGVDYAQGYVIEKPRLINNF
ncbi:DUF1631 family protein [Alkalimarinus alittae]|uniref:DUF1631 family protein n=1 Tax=Alkalimarinus alittae TaxID=2961619 RepID=A0ABY6N139_9ALTE|nr:DUF1631 family protein [Alkalimarinus alittae]UZE95719.1 DUF1631 family protein [Alkalimarinus alittae]